MMEGVVTKYGHRASKGFNPPLSLHGVHSFIWSVKSIYIKIRAHIFLKGPTALYKLWKIFLPVIFGYIRFLHA